MTENTPLVSNADLKQASLLLLQDKMNASRSDKGFLQTANVFIAAVPIPESAPEAYRITETALRQVMIEKALFEKKQLDILTEAFDSVFLLDDEPS